MAGGPGQGCHHCLQGTAGPEVEEGEWFGEQQRCVRRTVEEEVESFGAEEEPGDLPE